MKNIIAIVLLSQIILTACNKGVFESHPPVMIGQTWYMELEEANPFQDAYGYCKVITDIKDEWISYIIYDTRNPVKQWVGVMEIKDLWNLYELVQND